jgi:hypothetical protein
LQIARVDGANVSIIAVLWSVGANSVAAGGDGALVRCIAEWNVLASDVLNEGINSARVSVVTVWNDQLALVGSWIALVGRANSGRLALNWVVDASSDNITVSGRASWSRWANSWSLDNSDLCIASGDHACVRSNSCDHGSGDVIEDAVSGGHVARVSGASVVVIARLCLMNWQSSVSVAVVSGACISVVALDWSVRAESSLSIASINSALVVVIADDLLDVTLSGQSIARGREAHVLSLADGWSVDASG